MKKISKCKYEAQLRTRDLIKKLRFTLCGYEPKTVAKATGLDVSEIASFMEGCVSDMTLEDFFTLAEFIKGQDINSNYKKNLITSVDGTMEDYWKNSNNTRQLSQPLSKVVEQQQTEVTNDYNNALLQAQKELFFTTKPLESLLLTDLKRIIYKNGWYKEFYSDQINDRQAIILFLYNKLEKRVKELLLDNMTTSISNSEINSSNEDESEINDIDEDSKEEGNNADNEEETSNFEAYINGKKITNYDDALKQISDLLNKCLG